MIGYITKMSKEDFMDKNKQISLLMCQIRKDISARKKIFKMKIREGNNQQNGTINHQSHFGKTVHPFTPDHAQYNHRPGSIVN
jgi:ABC-type transport system substrate-binding protein